MLQLLLLLFETLPYELRLFINSRAIIYFIERT